MAVIKIYDPKLGKLVAIDPEVQCRRCGAIATDCDPIKTPVGERFRVCKFHCAGCLSTNVVENPIEPWPHVGGSFYRAPMCQACYNRLHPFPDEIWLVVNNTVTELE